MILGEGKKEESCCNKTQGMQKKFYVNEKKSKVMFLCPNCHEFVDNGNFCSVCRTKMVKICDCWILHTSYDCGKNSCPESGNAVGRFIREYHRQRNLPTH
jgi:hypothetical protein